MQFKLFSITALLATTANLVLATQPTIEGSDVGGKIWEIEHDAREVCATAESISYSNYRTPSTKIAGEYNTVSGKLEELQGKLFGRVVTGNPDDMCTPLQQLVITETNCLNKLLDKKDLVLKTNNGYAISAAISRNLASETVLLTSIFYHTRCPGTDLGNKVPILYQQKTRAIAIFQFNFLGGAANSFLHWLRGE